MADVGVGRRSGEDGAQNRGKKIGQDGVVVNQKEAETCRDTCCHSSLGEREDVTDVNAQRRGWGKTLALSALQAYNDRYTDWKDSDKEGSVIRRSVTAETKGRER